ncbi:MAG: cytochrome P450 [Acidimicrobiales bacterium]
MSEQAEVVYNPFEPGFTDDPYPHYRALREGDPVQHHPMGFWVLSAYEDVLRLLRDPAGSVDERQAWPTPMMEVAREVLGDQADRGSHAMLNVDPPDHTRLRRLVSKAFTPRMIERLRPRVVELVEQSLRAASDSGSGSGSGSAAWDLIDGLAFPLPFQVITDLLGMPDTDITQLREWSAALVRTLEPVPDVETLEAIADASRQMSALIVEAIAWKRAHPGDDLLSGLIAVEEAGEALSERELIDQVALLYIAGHETTVNLIGNGTLALLGHRDQLTLLREDPALDAGAVEELLRYDSPVQMSRRITLQPVAAGDETIEGGSFVLVLLASANRDPAKWGAGADCLDLRRPSAREHLAFGGGHHHCLGAALARLEAQVAIPTLVRHFPSLDLAGPPVWNGRINLRGLARLPLSLGG